MIDSSSAFNTVLPVKLIATKYWNTRNTVQIYMGFSHNEDSICASSQNTSKLVEINIGSPQGCQICR